MKFLFLLSLAALAYGFIHKPHFIARKMSPLFETTADFKNGMTFEIDNVPHKLLEFLHVKPGKGSAFVRSKVKNLVTGGYVTVLLVYA